MRPLRREPPAHRPRSRGISIRTRAGPMRGRWEPPAAAYFLGGQSNYKYFDSTGEHDSGIGFYRHGARVKVIVGTGSPASYSVLITLCSGTTAAFSGTLAATGGPAKVVLFNNNAAGGSVS